MKKNLGQVFTPKWVVNLILDTIDYKGSHILNKKIIEPSCGDGSFLLEIYNRYLTVALQNNESIKNILYSLKNNIIAYEVDEEVYKKCIDNVSILIKLFGIEDFELGIYNVNALEQIQDFGSADFVVGNPPYVRIHDIDNDTRTLIKNNFPVTSKGMLELYLVFFELGIKLMNSTGIMGYITPNSFMCLKTAADLREYIVSNNLLNKFINFEGYQVFDKASTYSSITILDKNKNSIYFKNYCWKNDKLHFVSELDINKFKNKQWNFYSKDTVDWINNNTDTINNLGSISNIQYSLVTLRDKIYISNDVKVRDENTVFFQGIPVEKEILRRTVKGSRYTGGEPDTYILFPYTNKDGQLVPYEEDIFKSKYPLAYHYLLLHKDELMKRDMDDNATKWFQYGRSQGIQNSNEEKLVFKQIIKNDTTKLIVHKLPNDVIVHGGIFITGDNLDHIKEILESENFANYIIHLGKDKSGGYKEISPRIMKQFKIIK